MIYDVLVIGEGIAGSIAALQAAELGASVCLVSTQDSASGWAQGGIVYQGDNDPQQLMNDIRHAGCDINFPPVVELVSVEGPDAVDYWLREKLQVSFDQGLDGNSDLALEAAHNSHRILHVRDFTGRAIMEKMREAVRREKKIVRREAILVDFLLSDRHDTRPETSYRPSEVVGAYVFFPQEDRIESLVAKSVILATGGFSQLYLHSTGPRSSRGDGIAAGHRAGARTMNLEYVQFHPTALYIPGEPRKLLTEALRGSGAKLLSIDKKPFVNELEARDIVARAIHNVMIETQAPHVWMDMRSVKNLKEKFPDIVKLLGEKGFRADEELIPVVPAAHYTIGGVWTDIEGRTNMPGLWSVGEVACTGLHGANRLASTSLLEGLVFGERAARGAVERAQKLSLDFSPKEWVHESGRVDPALLQQDWRLLKQTLWNYVGLVRSARRLERAEKIIASLRYEIESFYRESALSEELIGLRNGVLVATLLLYSALRNPRSIGTHFLKEDY